jgi:hypothetical protein
MPSLETQRRAFRFLSEHLQSQETFTRSDFQKATGWSDKSFQTYLSKQFRPFLDSLGGTTYRVSEAFRPYVTWRKFRQHVTQVRRVVTDYSPAVSSSVLICEFFMPLTHENALRTTLDSLFYKDRVLARLRTLGVDKIKGHFPAEEGKSDDEFLEALCTWIDQKFQGYSISHVDGRFRAESLCTQEQAVEVQKQGRRYLIDETTAVARFVFPCQDEIEAAKVRFLFMEIFVRSVIQLVSGEDEIWMIESGMANRVHVWKAADAEEEGQLFE